MLVRTPTIGGQKRLITPFGSGAPKVHRVPSGGLTDTFRMSRRQTLWPQLNTAESGTWAWSGSASRMFGGMFYNTSNSSGDYVEWANVNTFNAAASLNLLYAKGASGGIISIYWNGTKYGEIDTDGSGNNFVSSVSLGTLPGGRGTLRLISESTNGGGYSLFLQQVELVQPTGTAAGTSLDDLPWCQDVPPVSYDSITGPGTLVQNTSGAWGSSVRLSNVQNDYAEYKVWLAQGTYDFDMVFVRDTNRGIATVSVDGSDVGTIDMYGATAFNIIGTISSISVATTGVHTVRLTMATKNASSGDYEAYAQWIQFRKTTTTGAITATGTTYGRETMELWPWFADTTDSDKFTIGSTWLNYGIYYVNSPAINDAQEYATGINSGTYSVIKHVTKWSGSGIVHLSNGGGDLDTADLYTSSTVYNTTAAMSAPLVAGTIRLAMDSKHVSSSNYFNYLNFTRLIRTGA